MQDSSIDYYEVLHLHPSAHPDVVQAAYRRLALLYHPDKNPSPEATNLMAQVNQAYEVLSDPEKRAAYDRSLEARSSRPTPPPSYGTSTGGGSRPSAGSSSGRQSGTGIGYITLGSSKSDVIRVQGSPIDSRFYPNLVEETWYYDSGDYIDFDLDTDRVRGWSNHEGSLRIWLIRGPNVTSRGFFEEGDYRGEVANLQGTPIEISVSETLDREIWTFHGGSSVEFSSSTGLVTDWEDLCGTLKVSSEADSGNWRTITNEFNPETQSTDVTIVTRDLADSDRSLMLRFRNGVLDIFVNWNSEVSYTDDTLVSWCIDNGQWLQCLWDVSESLTTTFMPESEIAEMVGALSQAQTLSVGINTAVGDFLYAFFHVGGFHHAFEPVFQAWNQLNNWRTITDDFNPGTGTRDVTIVTEDPTDGELNLMVRFRNGELDIFLNWGTEITYSGRAPVRWKIDNGPWRRRSCGVSADFEATFMPDGEVRDLIRGLSDAEVFSVRVNPFGGNPITATFQVDGFASAVQPVLEAWHQAGGP